MGERPMLKPCFTASMIAVALSAHGGDYVTASGMPLKTGYGDWIHTGYWTPPARVAQSTTVLFPFDGDRLDDEARATLDRLLARYGEIEKLYVTAHADRIGGKRYNSVLSERRLETVRNYLATKGIALTVLYAEAVGDDEPSTRCERMEPENRRNKTLVDCLRPDRRADVEVIGEPRELARSATRE
jgi:outer membrane protein OmpA-like peptidoglycan-associated protein